MILYVHYSSVKKHDELLIFSLSFIEKLREQLIILILSLVSKTTQAISFVYLFSVNLVRMVGWITGCLSFYYFQRYFHQRVMPANHSSFFHYFFLEKYERAIHCSSLLASCNWNSKSLKLLKLFTRLLYQILWIVLPLLIIFVYIFNQENFLLASARHTTALPTFHQRRVRSLFACLLVFILFSSLPLCLLERNVYLPSNSPPLLAFRLIVGSPGRSVESSRHGASMTCHEETESMVYLLGEEGVWKFGSLTRSFVRSLALRHSVANVAISLCASSSSTLCMTDFSQGPYRHRPAPIAKTSIVHFRRFFFLIFRERSIIPRRRFPSLVKRLGKKPSVNFLLNGCSRSSGIDSSNLVVLSITWFVFYYESINIVLNLLLSSFINNTDINTSK